jgi:hypothetical protein
MIAAVTTLVFAAGLWLSAATLASSLGENRGRIVRALAGLA